MSQVMLLLLLLQLPLLLAGEDVCREVSEVASQVIIAARSWKNPNWASDPRPFGPKQNVSRRGMVQQLHPDGRVEFTEVGLKKGVLCGLTIRSQLKGVCNPHLSLI
jgi:hypothetical protein